MLIIAHRGASGTLPENTLEAYKLAIDQDADIIEIDIITTKDKVLIARHDVYLSRSTNVASILKFANRKTTKIVDGTPIEDWFAMDFTWEEIQELKSTQPFLDRPQQYNNQFNIPSLSEIIDLIKEVNKKQKKQVGLCIEIKNSTFHENHNLSIEKLLIRELKKQGWDGYNSPIIVISFEVNGLKYIKENIGVKVFQLFDEYNIKSSIYPQPYDFVVKKDKRTYKDLLTKEGLIKLKKYVDGLCLWKGYLLDKWCEITDEQTNLVDYAHQIGLKIFLWTFNKDKLISNSFSIEDEYGQFIKTRIDGMITDYPEFAKKQL